MLKLISVNIEKDRHLEERFLPFLQKENPDILCVQEIFEKDIEQIKTTGGFEHFVYAPMTLQPSVVLTDKTQFHSIGVAIFIKKLQSVSTSRHYYVKDENIVPFERPVDTYAEPHNNANAVCFVSGESGDSAYTFATTHCCITPNGDTTACQLAQAEDLLQILAEKSEFVFCGDLNAPRGKEAFALFAEKYMDNIPLEYDSSIDPVLHRVPTLRLMVDGLFTTPQFAARDVALVEGVSDHKAIVATISKNS